MASQKEIEAQLRKVASQIEYLKEVTEERTRLTNLLKLTPSKADNLELIDSLSTTKKALNFLFNDIDNADTKENTTKLTELIKTYNDTISSMESDSHISIEEYRFTRTRSTESKKSVRFKDNQEEVDETENLRNELMGTAKSFKPYSDSDDLNATYESDRNTLSSIDTTNREMFASHQQQMLEQDQDLDVLSNSIQNQYRIGLNINNEIDEHMIILNDLERGVDGSGVRLRRAANGIADFRRKVKENGSLTTIIVLTVILILLLVVLN